MKRRYFWFPLAVGILIPSMVIFFLQVFFARISPLKAIIDILQMQFGKGDNLFLLMVFSFIPFGLLMIETFVLEAKVHAIRLACIFWGGFIAVLAISLYIHISVRYPQYSAADTSSTDSLAFLLLPVLGPIMLVIGSLIGWGVSFLFKFNERRK